MLVVSMIPERAWSLAFEATFKDPGAGGAESGGSGAGGAGLEASFLTTIGADFAAGGALGAVFDSTVEFDFLAGEGRSATERSAEGRSGLVESVTSGPCSTPCVLAG